MGFREQRRVAIIGAGTITSIPKQEVDVIAQQSKPTRREGERYRDFQRRLDNWIFRQTVRYNQP